VTPHSHSPYSLGVIGYPLAHSHSPRLHEAALRASRLTGEYRLYLVPPLPAGQESLEVLIDSLRDGHLDGLNITLPHKQAVISFLDELTPLAAQIQAVNTIYRRGYRLIGDNTDAPGFLADLKKQFPQAINPQAALVLGSGGSACAVVYALLTAGWHVTLAARRPDMARNIKDSFSSIRQSCEVIGLGSLQEFVFSLERQRREPHEKITSPEQNSSRPLSLIVNTTPIGMAPESERSPWPDGLPFPKGAFVYDLVYNPVDTALVRAAREAGLVAASGLGMLIEQAALSFERWTGIYPSLTAMQQAMTTGQV
jgi:shikimate dehydrogenase